MLLFRYRVGRCRWEIRNYTVGTRFTVVHICHGKMYLNAAYKVTIQRPKVSMLLSSVFLLYAIKNYFFFLFSFLLKVAKHLVTNATLSAETTSYMYPLLFAKPLANNHVGGEIHENWACNRFMENTAWSKIAPKREISLLRKAARLCDSYFLEVCI